MELRVLNYFLAVAREENITKAAQLLHVTQPTLSRQLMQLEDELGVKLFKRSNHSMALTEDGMLLKRRAQELVSLAQKTKAEFLQTQDIELTGEIAIGSGELRSVAFLADIVAHFQKEHPLVHYNLYSGSADSIKERIETGLLDIGLLSEPVDIGKYEFLRMPNKEIWGVLVRSDSELAQIASVAPRDLIGKPLFMSHRGLVKNELSGWFGMDYEKLNIVASYNLLYNASVMVRSGIGIAICIKLDCQFDGLSFVPFALPLELGSVLVWKKNQSMSPTVAAFLDYSKGFV